MRVWICGCLKVSGTLEIQQKHLPFHPFFHFSRLGTGWMIRIMPTVFPHAITISPNWDLSTTQEEIGFYVLNTGCSSSVTMNRNDRAACKIKQISKFQRHNLILIICLVFLKIKSKRETKQRWGYWLMTLNLMSSIFGVTQFYFSWAKAKRVGTN